MVGELEMSLETAAGDWRQCWKLSCWATEEKAGDLVAGDWR